MSTASIKKHLKTKEFAPVYLFFGEEDYLKRYYFEQLKTALISGDFADFNYHVFDADKGLDFEQLNLAFENLPVFSQKKLVKVVNFDFSRAENRDRMERMIADLPEYVCLVFYYIESGFVPDKRLNIIKLIEKKGAIINFERPNSKDLQSWAFRHFAAKGKRIGRKELEYLLSICSNDMNALSKEIEKICSYAVVEEITCRHIDAVATRTLESDVFELTDALIKGESDKVFQTLQILNTSGKEPIIISAVIGKTLCDLYRIKAALEAGRSADQITKSLKLPWFVVKKYIPAARSGSIPFFSNCIDCALNANLALKGSRAEKTVILEILLAQLLKLNSERRNA